MTREQAKATIRSRVVINVNHIKSLHSVDEVIDQLCDEHEDRMREKDIEIESLKSEKQPGEFHIKTKNYEEMES